MARAKTIDPQQVFDDYLKLSLYEKIDHFNAVRKNLSDELQDIKQQVSEKETDKEKLQDALQVKG